MCILLYIQTEDMAVINPQLYVIDLILRYLIFHVTYNNKLETNLQDQPYVHGYSNRPIADSGKLNTRFVYECEHKTVFQLTGAKGLGICITKQSDLNSFIPFQYSCNEIKKKISNGIHEMNNLYSTNWSDNTIENLSNGILKYLRTYIPMDCSFITNGKIFPYNTNYDYVERFRRKRDEVSASSSNVDCTGKLETSRKCYSDQLSELRQALESSQHGKEQHDAGCNFIRRILTKCNQVLCNHSKEESDPHYYSQYVSEVLKDFDVQSCGTF